MHVTDFFDLPTEDLRAADGALDAGKIAGVLGVPVDELLRAAAAVIPDKGWDAAAEVQESPLESYASVIAMVRDVYGGNQAHVRTWFETPHQDCGGSTPLAVMLTPRGASAVEQWVSRAWLGIPD